MRCRQGVREANCPQCALNLLNQIGDLLPSRSKNKPKNRYVRSAKLSEYKTLQIIECFARDLSIQQAAKRTRITERSVRDRYSDIRSRLLGWSIANPDRFNGLGHLLLDPGGTINIDVLEALLIYSHTATFKRRMSRLYPRWNTRRDPALHHVIEYLVRRWSAIRHLNLPQSFSEDMGKFHQASQDEVFLRAFAAQKPERANRFAMLRALSRRMTASYASRVVRFSSGNNRLLLRDLKAMMRS